MKAGVMKLQAVSAIFLCFFSVFGLYALFLRIAAMLSPRGDLMVTVDGRNITEEEILLRVARARFLLEKEGRLAECPAVLLSEDDANKEGALRKEGVLVFIIKTQ